MLPANCGLEAGPRDILILPGVRQFAGLVESKTLVGTSVERIGNMDRKPDIHGLIGLTTREANNILERMLPTSMTSDPKAEEAAHSARRHARSMFLLLVACGAIYLVVGRQLQEALMLLALSFRYGDHPLPGAKI